MRKSLIVGFMAAALSVCVLCGSLIAFDGNDYGDISYSFPIIFLLIITLYIRKKNDNLRSGQVELLPDRTARIKQLIKQHYPNFSASDFQTFAKQVYPASYFKDAQFEYLAVYPNARMIDYDFTTVRNDACDNGISVPLTQS